MNPRCFARRGLNGGSVGRARSLVARAKMATECYGNPLYSTNAKRVRHPPGGNPRGPRGEPWRIELKHLSGTFRPGQATS